MRGTSNSGGSAPDAAGTIVVQLSTPPVPPSNFVLVLRHPGISGQPSSVPQGYPGRGGFPCPRDFRVAAVFRAPGISGSPRSSVTQNNSGGCLPCPRKLRLPHWRTELTAATRGGARCRVQYTASSNSGLRRESLRLPHWRTELTAATRGGLGAESNIPRQLRSGHGRLREVGGAPSTI